MTVPINRSRYMGTKRRGRQDSLETNYDQGPAQALIAVQLKILVSCNDNSEKQASVFEGIISMVSSHAVEVGRAARVSISDQFK